MCKIVSFFFTVLFIAHCAGNKGTLRLEDLEYPVSMSGYIYDENLRPVRVGDRLKKITDVKASKTLWSLLYGQAALSDNTQIIRDFNTEVRKSGGIAVVNLEIEHTDCFLNSFIIFNLIPIWPGCSKVQLSGDVVAKEK